MARRMVALLGVLVGAASAGGDEQVMLEAFAYPDSAAAQGVWRPVEGPPVEVEPGAWQGRNALRLPCPFSQVKERCFWDAEVRWDLSRYGAFSLWVKVEAPSALARGTVYFRSGQGWYGGWFTVRDSDWHQVRWSRMDFTEEGQPTGWHAIDGVRLSFWKGEPRDTVVWVAALEGFTRDVVVVRGDLSLRRGSPEATGVRQYAEQTLRWLAQAGLEVGMLSDRDVEAGALAGAKVALLPYNPDASEQEVAALRAFVEQGGKLIVAYSLPSELAPLLGIEPGEWKREEYPGQLARIRLREERLEGLPERVLQNSWNALFPQPRQAEVLGTWEDGQGKDTGLPAITWHPNGVFIGHVLTPGDAEAKTQLLLALLVGLRPELKGEVSRRLLARLGQFLHLPDWNATVSFIEQQAERNGRSAEVRPLLEEARSLREEAQRAALEGTLTSLLERIRQTQETLRRAWACSFSSRAPEFRALWCHSAFGISGWTWEQAIRHLAEHGFNAILPNMLWAGRAYYPSQVLPTMPEVETRGDQIALCLEACRRYGVEIHVWKVNWNLSGAPQEFVERLRREGRLQRDVDGQEVLWLCPSDPRNFELERDSMLEVVRNYPVDGIHFDYIRYPHQRACYCEGCRQRFQEAMGQEVADWPQAVWQGPLREEYREWRRQQITRLVEAVSREARRLRPGIRISAAVFRDYPNCRDTVGQDWVLWVERGYLDFVCPMDYMADDEELANTVRRQLDFVAGRVPLYPGIGASAPGLLPEQVIWQIQRVRDVGAPGFVIFNYDLTVAEQHLPALRLGITRP